jgi:hypothetical protein
MQSNSLLQANSFDLLSAYASDAGIDCGNYADREEYANAVKNSAVFKDEVRRIAKERHCHISLARTTARIAKLADMWDTNGRHRLITMLVPSLTEPIKQKYREIEAEVLQEKLDAFDAQCNDSGVINVPGNEHISIDFNCPIPDMASVTFQEHLNGDMKFEYYQYNGHVVGPYVVLYQRADSTFEYAQVACYNTAGQQNGWALSYSKTDGELYLAAQYQNGLLNGHHYSFYPDGGWVDAIYQDGNRISSVYHAP